MDKGILFLTIMATLSASSQTLTEHLVKKQFTWLDQPKSGKAEAWRQALVHLICAALGGVLAASAGLHPLKDLAGENAWWLGSAPPLEYVFTGILVSYGGSFFDEALGLLREFKKARERLKATAADKGDP